MKRARTDTSISKTKTKINDAKKNKFEPKKETKEEKVTDDNNNGEEEEEEKEEKWVPFSEKQKQELERLRTEATSLHREWKKAQQIVEKSFNDRNATLQQKINELKVQQEASAALLHVSTAANNVIYIFTGAVADYFTGDCILPENVFGAIEF